MCVPILWLLPLGLALQVWVDYEEEHSRILEDRLGGAMDSSDPERRLNAKTELTIYGTTYTVDCWSV